MSLRNLCKKAGLWILEVLSALNIGLIIYKATLSWFDHLLNSTPYYTQSFYSYHPLLFLHPSKFSHYHFIVYFPWYTCYPASFLWDKQLICDDFSRLFLEEVLGVMRCYFYVTLFSSFDKDSCSIWFGISMEIFLEFSNHLWVLRFEVMSLRIYKLKFWPTNDFFAVYLIIYWCPAMAPFDKFT